ILPANGQGFGGATLAMSTSTSDSSTVNTLPGAVVAGDFNLDGRSDLAVVMEDTGLVWVYTGYGDGTFRPTFSIPVGDGATGLALAPGNGPGLYEMLVGNRFGDVLILDGKGDGTFQISGKRVSISVVPDLLGPGQAGVLVGNQQTSTVTVQTPSGSGGQYTPVSTLGGGSSSSQLAPGDVEWAFLDRSTKLPDAIVVSTGSNAVVVYRTLSITNGAPVFAAPQTYFVGTAPAGVTVADISGDGIPDLVVSNKASNDVSVLFGSRDADGTWAGIAGPRLRSGGVGPDTVVARDLTGDGILDLVVINGDSGTITLLPGVGQGFFDDQAPTTLVNLGAALVQPPTFVGSASVGYAVTATGTLLRFDLSNPGAGASVVYSSEPVVAAQALATGKVAVALASGAVNLLEPSGDGLVVTSQLQARGGTAVSPSSINVVENSRGGFSVLVSSQGSDTLFVYAPDVSTPLPTPVAPRTPSLTGFGSSSSQPTTSLTSSIGIMKMSTVTSISQTSASTSTASSSSSTSAVGTAGLSITALSLGGFTSLGKGSSTGTGSAELVGVEGNSYFSVPVLDFGSELDEVDASRIPGLATEFPIGDASPLNQFIVGLEEALHDYLGADETLPPGAPGSAFDPWNADLFGIRRALESRVPGAEANDYRAAPDPPVPNAASIETGMHEQPEEPAGTIPESPSERIGARLSVMAGFASAFLLIPWLERTARTPRSIRLLRESR
ncbi:MAG: VCBS repeat-containing protein, partial [Isosphaeraceae bacterium]